jgi:N-acylglucosamine-6-phosphate 2-epimerase
MLDLLAGGLVVSCQPLPDVPEDPLRDPHVQARIAAAVVHAGAVAIRVNGPDITAASVTVAVPVIGLWKQAPPGVTLATGVVITPTARLAIAAADAGAGMVAVDATDRPRPEPFAARVASLRAETQALVLADVSTAEEGVAAADAGADAVATTLSGIVPGTGPTDRPDLDLVERLACRLHVPVIAEGRYRTAADVAAGFDAGAHAVVVGNAATSPLWIVRQLVRDSGAVRRPSTPGPCTATSVRQLAR